MSKPPTARGGLAAALVALRARLGEERGSLLIEVMVGAIVLAIATVAIMNGLDGAQGTGARNKARSVAAALAEQDQDRMRSIPPARLAQLPSQTRTVRVRGVDYTVKSTAGWVVDQGGVVSCANNARTAANLRIVSEVSSPLTRGVVDEASLVTPPPGTYGPNQGRLIVKVVDRDQEPWPGLAVTLSGTAPYSETTNALGCAVFPFIPAGDYQARVNGTGLVNWDGESPVYADTTVTAGTSTTVPLELDQPAKINLSFQTKVASAAAVASDSQWATVVNGKMTPDTRVFESITRAPAATVTASGLFPFLDGYGAYAGRCEQNNPEEYGYTLPQPTPLPAQTLTFATRLWTPSINIRTVGPTGSTVVTSGVTVFVTTADGCDTTYPSQVANTSGALPKPGYPYGNYRICAQRTVGTTTTHGHADVRGSGYAGTGTHVNDIVQNNVETGNSTTTTNSRAIQVRLSQSGACH